MALIIIKASKVLRRGLTGHPCEFQQPVPMDALLQSGRQIQITYDPQSFDEFEHVLRIRRTGRLSQPGQRGDGGSLFVLFEQTINPLFLQLAQGFGEHAVEMSQSAGCGLRAKAFNDSQRRHDDFQGA